MISWRTRPAGTARLASLCFLAEPTPDAKSINTLDSLVT